MKEFIDFWKLNKKTVIFMLALVVIIILLCIFANLKCFFDAAASVVAIPAFIMSFVVISVVNITPKNLDAYYKRRVKKENEIIDNNKKLKELFDEHLKEVEIESDVFKLFLLRKLEGKSVNEPMKKKFEKALELFHEFLFKTNRYLKFYIDQNEGDLGNIGRITDISEFNLSFSIDSKEIELLIKQMDKVFKLNSLYDDALDDNDKNLLRELFDDNSTGLCFKYLSVCNSTYNELNKMDLGGNNE